LDRAAAWTIPSYQPVADELPTLQRSQERDELLTFERAETQPDFVTLDRVGR